MLLKITNYKRTAAVAKKCDHTIWHSSVSCASDVMEVPVQRHAPRIPLGVCKFLPEVVEGRLFGITQAEGIPVNITQ